MMTPETAVDKKKKKKKLLIEQRKSEKTGTEKATAADGGKRVARCGQRRLPLAVGHDGTSNGHQNICHRQVYGFNVIILKGIIVISVP